MSSTILERARSSHEDVELFERGIVEALIDDAKNHRENVNHSHWVNTFAEKIIGRTEDLNRIYEDEDGARKAEVASMGGKGAALFENFYSQLHAVQNHHRKFPNSLPERPEAEQMLNSLDITKMVQFSGEESYGRYLDLNPFFTRYINLKGVKAEGYTYTQYLTSFYEFPDRDIQKNKQYRQFLTDLNDYLVDFFRRAQPLDDLEAKLNQNEEAFKKEWENDNFIPIGHTDADAEREASPLWDKYSQRLFTNENAYKGYVKGKKCQRFKKLYETVFRDICLLESQIHLLAGILEDVIEATHVNVERKMARTAQEAQDGEDEDSYDESSEEEEEVKLTKANYPKDELGNPIPFWLYKLHGLGIEYKCEICGNLSYWGRRAFERHFSEGRHTHGLKMLNIENSKEFYEVTKITDALALKKTLIENAEKKRWDGDTMEEYEDSEGNVMNRKTMQDLAAQGLL
eukprot:TRINITY_DN3187_c0_g1_i1.p1 TRINITY_DN3187_c0_g1~~TRINITY_DN3187_c0_g1_i1.p1  ORF type:complete len:459 (+),score=129.05 TRINITY_DN3187_c0_g1_i1:61-1437(+)